MENLSSNQPKYQALAANEIAALAFSQNKREQLDVPDWYRHSEVEKKERKNSVDFHALTNDDFTSLLYKLCNLYSIKYASVQLAACHALSQLLQLFRPNSDKRKNYTQIILNQKVDAKLFKLLVKNNTQLTAGANELLLIICLGSNKDDEFLQPFKKNEGLGLFNTYIKNRLNLYDEKMAKLGDKAKITIQLSERISSLLDEK